MSIQEQAIDMVKKSHSLLPFDKYRFYELINNEYSQEQCASLIAILEEESFAIGQVSTHLKGARDDLLGKVYAFVENSIPKKKLNDKFFVVLQKFQDIQNVYREMLDI